MLPDNPEPTGEFPHLRYEDLPAEAVKIAKDFVRGVLYNADKPLNEDLAAKNITKHILQSVGWEPRP